MNPHLITEIEIKNFKCFEDFKAKGFKRVNLIGGKNNVGKTVFLEACYINLNADKDNYVRAILKMVRRRDNFFVQNNATSFFKLLKTGAFLKTKLSKQYVRDLPCSIKSKLINGTENSTKFAFKEKLTTTIIEYEINKEPFDENLTFDDLKISSSNDYPFQTKNEINMVRPIGESDKVIVEHYEYLQRKNKEEDLNTKLNNFDDNIIAFKIINNSPELNTKSSGYISLSQFGDGVKHLVNIIISVYASENGYLFIDEIENGIHYTQLDRLWEIILSLSKELNCQVFATTHSKECIESYYRAATKLKDEDICFIELGKDKKDSVKAMVYSYDWLVDEIEQQQEIRGW